MDVAQVEWMRIAGGVGSMRGRCGRGGLRWSGLLWLVWIGVWWCIIFEVGEKHIFELLHVDVCTGGVRVVEG